jgi:uncharacterized Ntn-hydrolase superfamily protein
VTFSVVARDGDAVGVAVASKFLAVGSVVPGARQGVGAVATQSSARVAYVEELLSALADGRSPQDALAEAVADDDGRDQRQVGVVGAGGAATYTGGACMPWAGGLTGTDGDTAYAIQGNILVGPQVVESMERAWHDGAGRPLPRRLLDVLLAGDTAGGDARGRQSAALYVLAPGGGYDASGVLADLRVDDHPAAPRELARICDLHELYLGGPEDVQALVAAVADEVARRLAALGVPGAGSHTATALERWMGEANLEMRHSPGGIDARVLAELRAATPGA